MCPIYEKYYKSLRKIIETFIIILYEYITTTKNHMLRRSN